jgi:cytochrome oxidase assembly protein ShyY1
LTNIDLEDDEDVETTVFQVMRRPKWIGMLFLALFLAAVFALLGQWQLGRAIASGTVVDVPTEKILPLAQVAQPSGAIRTAVIGQKVTFRGSFSPSDYTLLEGRLNYGKAGYWVVGHVTLQGTDAAGHAVAIAVARGWAPDYADAIAAVKRLKSEPATVQTIVGRILPTEAPSPPAANVNPHQMQDMSTAALYTLWTNVQNTDMYEGYVIQKAPPAGLDAIYAPPPIEATTLDWLNVFYAAEWAIFAGFALFFWYRLVKDTKEKEDQEREEARAERLAALGSGTASVNVD